MVKEHALIPLFERFIRETQNGKRRKLNVEPIKKLTVQNYVYVLCILKDYEAHSQKPVKIRVNIKNNQKLIQEEQSYWKDFYRNFTDYLYDTKGYFDNYVGHVIKVLKAFFHYLAAEKYLNILPFYKRFYVRREEIRIITLLPEQYCFLVLDRPFQDRLANRLRQIKDLFVFGCTGALRYSDLMNLCVKDIEHQAGSYFLYFRSIKTDTPAHVKLPGFAVDIFLHYAQRKSPQQKLFPRLSKFVFNKRLRKLGEQAGWTQ